MRNRAQLTTPLFFLVLMSCLRNSVEEASLISLPSFPALTDVTSRASLRCFN